MYSWELRLRNIADLPGKSRCHSVTSADSYQIKSNLVCGNKKNNKVKRITIKNNTNTENIIIENKRVEFKDIISFFEFEENHW